MEYEVAAMGRQIGARREEDIKRLGQIVEEDSTFDVSPYED